jgi:hypothetical protein
MIPPRCDVTREIALPRELKQIRIQLGRHLLTRRLFSTASTRIVSENLLDIQDPLVCRAYLGLNSTEVGAHPVDDL